MLLINVGLSWDLYVPQAVWLWVKSVSSLNLGFLICEMEIMLFDISQGAG